MPEVQHVDALPRRPRIQRGHASGAPSHVSAEYPGAVHIASEVIPGMLPRGDLPNVGPSPRSRDFAGRAADASQELPESLWRARLGACALRANQQVFFNQYPKELVGRNHVWSSRWSSWSPCPVRRCLNGKLAVLA